MKHENIIPLLSLFIVSCGADPQLDKGYWDKPTVARAEETSDIRKFSSQITSLSETVGNITGSVSININQTDVTTMTQLSDVPQVLMLGQRSIRNISCSEIADTLLPLDILNNTIEYKDLNFVDSGSRESLIAELNDIDPMNGESVNLAGKSYVIEAYIDNLNTNNSRSISLVPIACGLIEIEVENIN
jgi:hypothetical protein